MKLLIMCPGNVPKSVDGIRCFTQVLNYYIPNNLKELIDVDVINLPLSNNEEVLRIFSSVEEGYAAVLVLGLRYFSRVPRHFLPVLRARAKCPIVQMHDGSRFDVDGVDLTLTFKDLDIIPPSRTAVHLKYNRCVGWAADHELFVPVTKNANELNVLIDHTNYGGGPDYSIEVLRDVFSFVDSEIWKNRYTAVNVRRLSSGFVEEVRELPKSIDQYDRTKIIPITDLAKHYGHSDIFIVTHPESLGLVVLETALCGSLVVCKEGFVSKDRLNTINHISYNKSIDWQTVLTSIDQEANRRTAMSNNWQALTKNIVKEISSLT